MHIVNFRRVLPCLRWTMQIAGNPWVKCDRKILKHRQWLQVFGVYTHVCITIQRTVQRTALTRDWPGKKRIGSIWFNIPTKRVLLYTVKKPFNLNGWILTSELHYYHQTRFPHTASTMVHQQFTNTHARVYLIRMIVILYLYM